MHDDSFTLLDSTFQSDGEDPASSFDYSTYLPTSFQLLAPPNPYESSTFPDEAFGTQQRCTQAPASSSSRSLFTHHPTFPPLPSSSVTYGIHNHRTNFDGSSGPQLFAPWEGSQPSASGHLVQPIPRSSPSVASFPPSSNPLRANPYDALLQLQNFLEDQQPMPPRSPPRNCEEVTEHARRAHAQLPSTPSDLNSRSTSWTSLEGQEGYFDGQAIGQEDVEGGPRANDSEDVEHPIFPLL